MKGCAICQLPWVGAVLLAALVGPARAAEDTFVFVEPEGPPAASGELVMYRRVDAPARLETFRKWLDNEPARMALDLYQRAWKASRAAERPDVPPPLYIALIKGGNHADIGLRVQTIDGVETLARMPYIKLDPEEWRFSTTLLHETGHMVLAALTGGQELPRRELAALPHSTAALTDRTTAFDEGFAIHLETLAAHLATDAETRGRYRHEQFLFGPAGGQNGEYFRHARDLLTFSQTIARYYEVRENNFAFESAWRGPDYLRVQFEKARDFSALRDANQLLQCEGFYAAFFFASTVRGDGIPARDVIAQRQDRLLAALADVLATVPPDPDTPYVVKLVEAYSRLYPRERDEVLDVFLDLTHGVFVDASAAQLWREHYLAALRLDLMGLKLAEIGSARAQWRADVQDDPRALYRRLGPQMRCEVPDVQVRLVALGEPAALSFDINTAPEGVLRLIPGMDDARVARWLAERTKTPFASVEDFKARAAPGEAVLGKLRF